MVQAGMNETTKALKDEGISLSGRMIEQVEGYVALVEKWNDFSSLVSAGDIRRLKEIHVCDSLGLAPVVRQYVEDGSLLDIGSGGGFPAIPLKIVLPELPMTLVERSAKKVGFLRTVIGALKLEDVTVVHGEFPICLRQVGYRSDIRVITARAVEKPEKIEKKILAFMPPGSCFLRQLPGAPGKLPEGFHVERQSDSWETRGLRRGKLTIVRRDLG